MEINIESRKLQKTLGKVASVINQNSLMPIMTNVLWDIKDGKITLIGSDLETTIHSTLSTPVDGSSFSVDAKLLLDLVKALPSESINIEVKDKMVVTSSKGNFTLPVLREEYPSFGEQEYGDPIMMKGYMLNAVLTATINSASTDDMRPTMTGVCFDFKEEGTTFVSTNSFKLNQYKTKLKGDGSKIIVSVPVLSNVLGLSDEEVVVVYNDRNIKFSYTDKGEEITVMGRLLEGNYPPYEKVVPTTLDCYLVVDSKEFTEAVKRAAIFSPGETKEVVLNTHQRAVYATNANYATHAANFVDMDEVVDEKGREIRFNATYLLDVLKIAGEGKIKMSFGEQSHAVLINNPATPGLTGLVMPLN